jgi:fatty acid amide hydrolase 2
MMLSESPLLSLSATRLSRLIRDREVTSRQVVEAHIARIRRVNPALNAVVAERFAAALKEADAADEEVRAAQETGADLPPFLGVPCTIKESFALTGMPHTSGLVARRGIVAARDAVTVARVRAAGAIPLGVTNLSELCMWMESNNRVYGRTRNPYDAGRIVGGSSGGEGAIVGAGGAPFGLGSDIGGSIRMPAFFNGVFGHKPTGGLVPCSGQYPIPKGPALRYITTGPLCRRAEDLMPLLRVLAGPDGEDTGCLETPASALSDPAAVDLRTLKVLVVPDNGRIRVSPELLAAQRRCAQALAAQGARVEEASFPALRDSLEIWSAMLDESGSPRFADLLFDRAEAGAGDAAEGIKRQERRPARELLRWVAGRSPHTLPALALVLLERLPALLPGRVEQALASGRALKEELHKRLGDRGVLLYPPYPTPAPKHNRPLFPPFNWVYTAILNVMELPVTQVPLGLGREGLPLGVQVAAGHGQDPVSIAVALFLERAMGGWVPPAT